MSSHPCCRDTTWSVNIRIVYARSTFFPHISSIKWLPPTTASTTSLIIPEFLFLVPIYTCVLVLYFTSKSFITHSSLLAGWGSTVLRSFILSRTRFSLLEEETLRCTIPQGIWVRTNKPYDCRWRSRWFRSFPLGFLQSVSCLFPCSSVWHSFEQQTIQYIWGKL